MKAIFKKSLVECKKINPYKFKGIYIYSIEEAIYIFYNNWKEFDNKIFEEDFIVWVKNELADINLAQKLKEIKNNESFYQKGIEFLTINNFYTTKELEGISLELFNWEKKGQSERLKILGDRFFKENLFEKSINFYYKALDFEPTNPILHNNIGICYIRIRKYTKALQYLTKAFELDSKNKDIITNLLEVCVLIKDDNLFSKYAKSLKEKYIYHYYLAELELNKKDFKNALENYAKSYLLNKDKNVLFKICDLNLKRENYTKALNSIAFLEEDREILIKKSEIYEVMQNFSKAIYFLEKLDFSKKENTIFLLKLSKLYRKNLDTLKAYEIITKIKHLEQADILFEEAIIKKIQGDFVAYQKIIQKIIKKSVADYLKIFMLEKDKKD